jgi:hypothetical protein
MGRGTIGLAVVLAVLGLAGCGAVGGMGRAPEGDEGTARLFLDRAWIDTEPGAAPGSLRLWSGGGTLVMASCAETPRVAAWRWTGPASLAWEEDGATVAAEIGLVGPEQMALVYGLGEAIETRRYRLAGEGPVC